MNAAAAGPGDPQLPASAREVATWRRRVALVFLLALVLRLLGNVAFEPLDAGPNPGGFYDGVEFNSAALHLVEEGRYVIDPGGLRSFRAPGFPLLIAAVYRLFGAGNHVAAHVAFCLVGALLTLATWKLARELTDRPTALLASLLVAVDPNLIYWCLHFSSEPLYTLLLTTSLWLLLRAWWRGSLGNVVLSGLLLGYAVLTRPVAIAFVPVLAHAFLVAARRRISFALPGALLLLLCAAIPLVPWTVRNWMVHGRFVLVATNGGSTFWGATNRLVLDDPALRGGWVTTNAMPEQKAQVLALPDEVDRDHAEWAFGKRFLAEHPAELPRLLAWKFLAFWTPVTRTPQPLFNWAVGLSYGLLLPFMLFGLVRLVRAPPIARGVTGARVSQAPVLRGDAGRARACTWLLVLSLLLTLGGSLVFYGSFRFRSVIEPLLLILAAAGLVQAWRRVRR